MQKRFSKSKIMILSIAIMLAILSFSIAVFGIIELNKKDKHTEGASEYPFTLNGKSYMLYWVDGRNTSYFYEDSNCSVTAIVCKGTTNTIYTAKGLYLMAYFAQDGFTETISIGANIVIPANSGFKGIGSSLYPYTKTIQMNGYTITNNSGYPLVNNVAKTITTAAELQEFASLVNSGTSCEGATIKLGANIDCSAISSFTPIGTLNNQFKGTFDGNGFTIKNLPICKWYRETGGYNSDYENYFGLFCYINGATIQNLYIDNAKWNNTMGSSSLGLHAGIMVGMTKGSSTINNCYIINSELKIYDNRSYYTVIKYGSYENEVYESQSSQGGLVGRVDNSSALSISNCGVLVNMESKGINNIGGYVGSMGSGATITIKNSYYKGSIKGQVLNGAWDGVWIRDMFFGGLVGGKNSTLNAENCYVSIQNVEMLTGVTYDGAGCSYAGSHSYKQFCANLSKNIHNKIYIKTSTLKYHKQARPTMAYDLPYLKELDSQVELLLSELF